MVKKKIDQRIRTLIENNVAPRHRSLFVIVGDRGKEQVINLHYILSKAQVAKRPSVLWCYKKELGFSSHRKKRMKQIKKKKQLGVLESEKGEDPFELFLSSTEIRYTYYHETDKILGNTFGMCVLQDFEALTPNLLARTVETVQGGGIVVLLLKTLTSLKQLYTLVMDVHSRYRTETKHDAVSRFNERFLLSLANCESCLVVDDQLNVLPISSSTKEIASLPNSNIEGATPEQAALEKLKKDLSADAKTKGSSALVNLTKTMDQANAVLSALGILAEHRTKMRTTVSLTAARGRGKSAALGLTLAGAIAAGYGNIFVTAPSPENVRTLFDFVFKGLDALGYVEHLDYDIVQSTHADFNNSIVRVNVFKADHRQTILYIQPSDVQVLSQAELVVIDEAAAIPLPLVQSMASGSHLVFMASTINGYEGTGRSLSLKLLQQLRQQTPVSPEGAHATGSRVLRELQLSEPIRYGAGDVVERWLNQLLCLDVATLPLRSALGSACPHPDQCELYAVNRDTLFSFHRASETFLQRMMSLYVASHYKNSPNDLQLMSDAPAHRLFVLLPPIDERNSTSLPDILSVLQVCMEGQISRQVILNNLARGKRGGGDLIPWTVSQQFQDDDFASLSGARVVRIAVHPEMQKMGYGTRAMQLLEKYFLGELFSADADEAVEEDENEEDRVNRVPGEAASGLHEEVVKPRSNLKPLLVKLSDKRPLRLHWLGTSFGLTPNLFKFWKRLGYLPVYLRQTTNDITGEHTAIMLKALNYDACSVKCSEQWLPLLFEDFRRRMISLLSFQFKSFPASLCLDIIDNIHGQTSAAAAELEYKPAPHDLKRIDSYANNMVDYHMILDLLPLMARQYFIASRLAATDVAIHLSPVQSAIVLALGLQHRSIEDVEKELRLPASQLLAMLIKAVRKFASFYADVARNGESQTVKRSEEAGAPSARRDLAEEVVWDPTPQTLDEDLNQAASEVSRQLAEKQRELINSLDLKQYMIGGTEEEWSAEIGKKRKSIGSTVVNISSAAGAKHSGAAAKNVLHEMTEKETAVMKKGRKNRNS